MTAAGRRPSIFAAGKNLAGGRIHFARGSKFPGPRKSAAFAGAQVRIPISELKSYLTEKLAY